MIFKKLTSRLKRGLVVLGASFVLMAGVPFTAQAAETSISDKIQEVISEGYKYLLSDGNTFSLDKLSEYLEALRDYTGNAKDLIDEKITAFLGNTIVLIPTVDITVTSEALIPQPIGMTIKGKTQKLSGAELVTLLNYGDGRKLVVWSYQTDLILNGVNKGKFPIYSKPFFVTVKPLPKGVWEQVGAKWKYKDVTGEYVTDAWKKIDGKWYHFNKEGIAASNEFVGGWWVAKNGVMSDTTKYSWHKTSSGWWYGVAGGWYAKDASYVIDGKTYFFNSRGYCMNP